VFAERYHARQLKTPLEVRRALLYVLRNDRKHRPRSGWSLPPWQLDPCSSAARFDGWRDSELLDLAQASPASGRDADADADADSDGADIAPPRSYLLRLGWKRYGLLAFDEQPASD
jgi:putative transposase